MDSSSSSSSSLSKLAIFRNTRNQELIRSVHVYRMPAEEGGERWVEREFLFSPTSCMELNPEPFPVPSPTPRPISRFREGEVFGQWLCMLSFDRESLSSSSSSSSCSSSSPPSSKIPSILPFSRNQSLENLPILVSDLQELYWSIFVSDKEKLPMSFASEEICAEKNDDSSISRGNESCSSEDQFSQSYPFAKDTVEENRHEELVPAEVRVPSKKRRAATEHVASITLADLAKYFNLPLHEASRNLKIGVTVLKRKCREFGISRWPHRKIKSLDTLIHDLEEEVNRQQENNEVVAVNAITRRQQKLEREKERIEKRPSMELQMETKRFRQDVFKRKHRARVMEKKCQQPNHP